MCLPCPNEENDTEDPEVPLEDPAVNSLEEMQSVDAISDLSSDPGSETAYGGGISDNSSCLPSSEIGKQKIPIGPKTGGQELLPGSTASEAQQSTQPGSLSSTTEEHSPRQSALGINLSGCSLRTWYFDNFTPSLLTLHNII